MYVTKRCLQARAHHDRDRGVHPRRALARHLDGHAADTVKYVLVSLKADNHGEGGIFALYSIVRKYGKWLIVPAMLGGAALLADGILTPAVTITTAIEGLRTIPAVHDIMGDNQMNVVVITLIIVCLLFAVQRVGTSKIGHAFGPVMTFWFLFLGGAGSSTYSATLLSCSRSTRCAASASCCLPTTMPAS